MPKEAPKTTKPDVETTPDASDIVELDFEGIKFSIPRDADNWPAAAELARLKAGVSGATIEWFAFVEELVGSAQWAVLLNAAPKRSDLYRLVGLISKTVSEECRIS